MWILGPLFLLSVLFTAVALLRERDAIDSGLTMLFVVLSVLVWLVFVGYLVAIPINRQSDRETLAKIQATRETITEARARGGLGSDLERVQLLQKVIEYNTWLAAEQYDRHHYFGLWVPAEVDAAQPIR